MKKALSVFVTIIFALSIATAAISANADGLGDVVNASVLSSVQDVINSSTDDIVPIAIGNGMITKSVVGSSTMILTAQPIEDSEFVAWYTSMSDLRNDKRFSEANPLRVDMKSSQKYYYAYFKSAQTTSSVSITMPSDVTLPSRPSTDPSSFSSQATDTTGTTATTAAQITADSKMVEGAYVIANEFSKSLSEANTTTTKKATSQAATTKAKAKNNVKKTSIKSVKGKKKSFKITWKKVSSAKGYQIKYSTNRNFFESLSKTKTVKKATTTSATVKDLRSGRTYFVKVRTYKTVKGKKVYSDWSKVKTVTVK